MLILTRRVGETLMIGENIQVVVLGVNGQQARLGIAAPKDVVILREELVSTAGRVERSSGGCSCHAPGGYAHEPDCTYWSWKVAK